jgi:negative regulator of sigma E activity
MSEEIHDQVSAFLDDELSGEECAFLVRRLERDPDARSKLVRYSLIGSTVRRDWVHPDPDLLRRRVHEALNGSSAPALKPAVAARPRWQRRVVAPAAGVGIAAGVALGALFVVRSMNDAGGTGPALNPAVQALAADTAASYVVPPDARPGSAVQAPIRLTNYLVHHGEYASLLSRTSVHSNVIGAFDASVAGPSGNSAADLAVPAAGRGVQ